MVDMFTVFLVYRLLWYICLQYFLFTGCYGRFVYSISCLQVAMVNIFTVFLVYRLLW